MDELQAGVDQPPAVLPQPKTLLQPRKAARKQRLRLQALPCRGIASRIARRGVESSEKLGQHRWGVEKARGWFAGFNKLRICFERRSDIHEALLKLRAVGCVASLGIELQELQRQDRQRSRLLRAIESKAASASRSTLSVENYFQMQIERAPHAHKLRKQSHAQVSSIHR